MKSGRYEGVKCVKLEERKKDAGGREGRRERGRRKKKEGKMMRNRAEIDETGLKRTRLD